MKRFLLTCLLVFFVSTAFAADNYYVDATGGDDGNDGKTSSSPWKSIGKVNSSYFQPGDTIHFKCGETWREKLTANQSGTEGSPITYTSYGSGCGPENSGSKPIINAAILVDSVWSQYSGNIYVTDIELLDNYINNDTFENDVSNWVVSSGSTITQESGSNCESVGDGCLNFTTAELPGYITSNSFDPAKSGIQRTFVLNFKASASQTVNGVQILVKNGTDTELDRTLDISAGWNAYTLHFQIANYRYLANAVLEVHLPAGSTLYLDDISIKPVVDQLFANGRYIKSAHHPNYGYLDIDGTSSDKSYLVDNDLAASLPPLCDPVEAGVVIRTKPWVIESRQVMGYENDNRLLLESNTDNSIYSGYGYYLNNKLCMLDQPDEWYYDEINQKLYVWLPDDMDPNPENALIEVSYNDYGIYVRSRNFISIDGLHVMNAAIDGIAYNWARDFVVTNTDVENSGNDGIYVNDSNMYGNGIIDNCTVKNSVHEGIQVLKSHGIVITNNMIEESGTVGSPRNSYAALSMGFSNDADISNNRVLNAGYHGISFVRGTVLKNNIIENTCLVEDDCGAIYTWNGTDDSNNLTPYNSRVEGNIINSSVGNSEGLPWDTVSANGIYLDNSTNYVEVVGNTVMYAGRYGINLNSAPYNTVQGNSVYGSGESEIHMREMNSQWSGPDFMKGNVITDNVFFPQFPHQPVAMLGDFEYNDFAVFDYNKYSGLYSDQLVHEKYMDCDPSVRVHYSYALPSWQLEERTDPYGYLVPQDEHSSFFDMFMLAPYSVNGSGTTEYIANGSFESNDASWAVFGGVNEWIEYCNESGGCLKFTSSQTLCNSHAYSNIFSLEAGKMYVLKFRVAAAVSGEDQHVRTIVRNTSWSTRVLEEAVAVDDTDWKEVKYVFTADSTMGEARMDFFLPPGQQAIYVDDVSIREVTDIEYSDIDNDSRILVNNTSISKDFNCPDDPGNLDNKCMQYVDIEENIITWPVSLEPFTSKIIIWGANPLRDIDRDGDPDPCEDADGDGYSSEGAMCGYLDINDIDPVMYRIEDLSTKDQNFKVKLQWTCAPGTGTYNIYRSTTQGGPYNLIETGHQTDGCNYFDHNITAGQIYYYTVRWVDSAGNTTADSNEAEGVSY